MKFKTIKNMYLPICLIGFTHVFLDIKPANTAIQQPEGSAPKLTPQDVLLDVKAKLAEVTQNNGATTPKTPGSDVATKFFPKTHSTVGTKFLREEIPLSKSAKTSSSV